MIKLPEPDSSLAETDIGVLEQWLTERATQLGRDCASLGWLLATAESCTGGMIARALTDTAGSSEWFDSGLVTYSNAAKMRLLSVPASDLDTHGAVSEPVARAMALGALAQLRQHETMAPDTHAGGLACSVTGVAGPGGGTADKPVGMVCFGWAGNMTTEPYRRAGQHDVPWVLTQTVRFDGNRHAVRLQTALHAIGGLSALVSDKPSG